MSAGIVIVGGGLAAAKTVAATATRRQGAAAHADRGLVVPRTTGRRSRSAICAGRSTPPARSSSSRTSTPSTTAAAIWRRPSPPSTTARSSCRRRACAVRPARDRERRLAPSPRRPGADLGGVYTLRTLANSTAIRERAAESRRAFIVGSNFIGLETAASLTQLGVEVTLCDRGDQLFRALETPSYSEYLEELYEEKGVELLFGDEVAEIRGDGRIASVVTGAARSAMPTSSSPASASCRTRASSRARASTSTTGCW